MATKQRMTFRRYGSSYHLLIETAEDLAQAAELDEAHWIATNAPVKTINCDETFLKLLDLDGGGRLTSREVKTAIRWLLEVLSDRQGVSDRSSVLRLDAINSSCEAGRRVHAAARKILSRSAGRDGDEIALETVRQVKAQVEASPVSEAGVVLPEAAEDEQVQQFIADVIAATGGAAHPGGDQGVGGRQLEEFLTAAAAQLDWKRRGALPASQARTDICPLGEQTAVAHATVSALRGKIDQYFAQCEAAALDQRFIQRMGWTEAELKDLDFDDPTVIEEVLNKAPIARANAQRELRFDEPINPYYAESLAQFGKQVLEPVLGRSGPTMSAGDWQKIKAVFAAHQAWLDAKPSSNVEALGAEKLRAYLDGPFADAVRGLIDDSAQAALELDNIRLVEKLILYQGNLIDLANNFVSFPHLYDPHRRAMFEVGTLVMDGRRFSLAVKVEDRARHADVAKSSNMYVLYVEVAGAGDSSYEVAVPVTAGGAGNLCIGKRGVFYDLLSRECDARVVQIIENPISTREALLSPFRRLGRLVTGKIESFAAGAEKKLEARTSTAVSQAAPAGRTSGLAAGGMLMGAGVAVAALGSAVAYVTKTLAGLSGWTVGIAILGAVLVVALPTAIIATLKLRRRDLSAILEGSGWAINARMRLSRKQQRFFTQRPRYPKGAKGIYGTLAFLAVLLAIAILALAASLVQRYL